MVFQGVLGSSIKHVVIEGKTRLARWFGLRPRPRKMSTWFTDSPNVVPRPFPEISVGFRDVLIAIKTDSPRFRNVSNDFGGFHGCVRQFLWGYMVFQKIGFLGILGRFRGHFWICWEV